MSGVFEPDDLGLGMVGHHLLGDFDGNIVVLASENEKHWNLRLVEHFVLILPVDHAVERGVDSTVLGDEDQFGQSLRKASAPCGLTES